MLSIDATHPLLSHCRAFMYPDGLALGLGWRSLTPLWRFRTENGLDFGTTLGQAQGAHPALHTGTPSPSTTVAGFYSYWNDIWPDDGPRDFTVICRATYRGSDPGSGQGRFVCGARGSGNNGGFLFGVWDAGGSDEGLAVFLYSHTTVNIVTDQQGFTDLIDRPAVLAVTYRGGDGRVTFYRNGTVTRSTTNTASDWNPYVNQADKQFIVGRADAGFIWPGEIGWVMVFARCLGTEEIAQLGRDAEWPFALDDDLMVGSIDVQWTLGDTLAATETQTDNSTWLLSDEVAAVALVDGDLDVGPPEPTVAGFGDVIGVVELPALSTPELVLYADILPAGDALTANTPVTYSDELTAGDAARGLIDGRADLIDTARYRR